MTSRADLHCHSTASQLSRLGVQRSLGLPECATPPREVYELAKKRGMDLVTITDHDTIDGALELEGLADAFVSEELTARFAGEAQAVHVLCYGITPGDHEWLQAHAGDQGRRRHRPRGRPLSARGLARRGRHRRPRPRSPRPPAGRRLLPRRPLYRRARRHHERRLRAAVEEGVAALAGDDDPCGAGLPPSSAGDLGAAAGRVFDALVPAFPYAPSIAFLGAEKAKLRDRAPGDRRRVALIADGIGRMHGVTHTIEQIRERGVPGFEVDVIGTDPGVDRRLPAVAELELPIYRGMRLGVPALPELVEALAEGGYDLVHVAAPGPAGVAATLLGRITGAPLVASYHTELAAYAGLRGGATVGTVARAGLGAFYGAPARVLSPSPAADASLADLGVDPAKVGRWERGVDTERFDPAKADRAAYPGEVKILYAGRLAREKGVDLLADAFLAARAGDPRLHLLLAGDGPEEAELRARLGDAATFLGRLGGEDLAVAYASADAFLFCSVTDTYGQVILEAGASGLPVIAIAAGGPATLVENRHTGLLCRPDPDHVAGSILQLAASPELRAQLGAARARAARARPWERSLSQLAAGYRPALEAPAIAPPAARPAA